jgi:hypothetical protein
VAIARENRGQNVGEQLFVLAGNEPCVLDRRELDEVVVVDNAVAVQIGRQELLRNGVEAPENREARPRRSTTRPQRSGTRSP